MNSGYSVVAFLWTIACARYQVSGQNSSESETGNTTHTFLPDMTTVSNNTSTQLPTLDISGMNVLPESNSSCVTANFKEFSVCLEALGDNSMKHFATKNITEFIADLCSPNVSKPHVECLARHFRACPAFLDTIHVDMLQFGPYHIKDIVYFNSVDHMCDCALGLICVQELNKIRFKPQFASTFLESPLVKVPDYKVVCNETSFGKFIDCTRKNMEICKYSLNQRFAGDFTFDDAEEVIRMYDFRRKNCDIIKETEFDIDYRCVADLSGRDAYKQCLVDSQDGSPQEQLCGMRDCIHNSMGQVCNSSTVDVYIDGINVYRHNQLNFLNSPCSSAVDIGLSILTVIFAVFVVLLY